MNSHSETLTDAPPTPPSELPQHGVARQPTDSGRKRRMTVGEDERNEAPGDGERLQAAEMPLATASTIDQPFKVQKERLIEAFERRYLRELMTWAGGNVSRAARKAKIDRMYLHRLLARHGIAREAPADPERT